MTHHVDVFLMNLNVCLSVYYILRTQHKNNVRRYCYMEFKKKKKKKDPF